MKSEPGRGIPLWVEAPSVVVLAILSILEGFRSAGGTLADPAPWVGVIASFAAFGRYRFARTTAVFALAAIAGGCVLPFLVVLYHFTSRGRMREMWVCLAIAIAIGVPWFAIALARGQSLFEGRVGTWTGLGNPVLAGLALALGMWAGSRRRLMEALKGQVEQLRVERELRAEQARSAERARIAREMHDVLAHRLSLLMLHTGVLQLQAQSLPPAVVARIDLLRGTAGQALDDLREVLGALRSEDPTGTGRTKASTAPALQDLAELLAEARAAGQLIDSEVSGDAASASTSHRLAVDRLVREALTNARKHAHTAPVGVRVHYGPPATTVEVVNGPVMDAKEFTAPEAVAAGPAVPGPLVVRVASAAPGDPALPADSALSGGYGLIGLAERVSALGGHLYTGATGGGWRLSARLPVPSADPCPASDLAPAAGLCRVSVS
ncbi:sensor histidine kinase [Streptomyces sp. NPDC057617]|uniref:sensor histidine kinase n=1 Tax=Streptomyces sp. NPDC057617 TaxID=3346184 RepID=UPI0036B75169